MAKVMTDEIYWQIRQLMTEEGAWNNAVNTKIYTTAEFIAEFGDGMSAKLKELLTAYVGRMQVYFDDRILEEKEPQD